MGVMSMPRGAARSLQGKISRDDVAELCVSLLTSRAAANTTFEVGSTLTPTEEWTGEAGSGGEWPTGGDNQGPGRNWEGTLRSAGLKPGVTGKTIDGVYTGKEPEDTVAAKGEREVAAA